MAAQQHPPSRRSRESSHRELSIGRYTRLDEIGRGSFATVYQGIHTKNRAYVAIKSVNLGKLNKKLKDNLSSEIEILKGLHHPHIVALIDCHESSSHIHLVMEYCALGDLSLFIKRRDTLGDHRYTRDMIAKYPNPRVGALNEVVVRHFLKQLASALKFLRDRNLIHRDIKPQNLLLCPSPASYRSHAPPPIVPYKGSENSFTPLAGLESLPMLKIADFGFARSLPSTSLAETLCGSPLYMAPEILRYEKYDAKADLWSVGTVLYEMVVGKPPFRATNHVELLRKIEKGEDRIKFPEDNEASDDIKKLIRGLLKRNPVERMTFKDFFDNIVVQGEIPGLVGEDRPPERRRSADVDAAAVDQARPAGAAAREGGGRDPPLPTNAQRPITPRLRSETPPDASPVRRVASGDHGKPLAAGKDLQRAAVAAQRPGPVSPAAAPGRQELPDRNPAAAALERQRSRTAHPPDASSSSAQMRERQRQEEAAREERERAAQDVAFERDYVVVEKRAVEVNAFADELANSPHIHGGLPKQTTSTGGAASRRATMPGVPPAAGAQATPAKAMQVAPGRGHHRQGSYERRYSQSPTSAISKALNMASGRLFGVGFSPPLAKGGRSPPLGYNPYPAYPTTQGNLMIVGDGAKTNVALDEDTKTVQIIEECATRSDVVYGFAEVKYKQLMPLTPSGPTGTAVKPGADPSDLADGGLTVDAVVTLCEEALVLYVKALSLLAKSMDIAGAWWARKNSGEAFGDSRDGMSATSALVGTRINNVVQWVRGRFNEVLEKAEFVRLKLIEGQRRLPPDHPSHPNNHPPGAASAGGLGTAAENVVVSTGVTAEKLMYDRALEMSRAAAINELTGEDLPGCEIAYMTAIRMLEAVLETDEVPRPRKGGDAEKGEALDEDKIVLDGVRAEDRKVVVKREYCFLYVSSKWIADGT
ncbi:Serine/threonine-protein kinase atg1 [Thermoascus aurantiacus ATCC 26904]